MTDDPREDAVSERLPKVVRCRGMACELHRDRYPLNATPDEGPECDHMPGHDCCECGLMDEDELARVRASAGD